MNLGRISTELSRFATYTVIAQTGSPNWPHLCVGLHSPFVGLFPMAPPALTVPADTAGCGLVSATGRTICHTATACPSGALPVRICGLRTGTVTVGAGAGGIGETEEATGFEGVWVCGKQLPLCRSFWQDGTWLSLPCLTCCVLLQPVLMLLPSWHGSNREGSSLR